MLHLAKEFKMNNNETMPSVGMGCYMGGKDVKGTVAQCMEVGLKAGYRHFDTAAMYYNESVVGKHIRESALPRHEFFVTTKLWNTCHNNVEASFDHSLKELDVEYIDLYLMHWPQAQHEDGTADDSTNFIDTWKRMEKLLETRAGKVKSIGVSNFSDKTLAELLPHCTIVPACNQIETHPYAPEFPTVTYCQEKGILVTAYTPLGQFDSPILKDKDILAIAEEVGAMPAQVILSWNVLRGIGVLPKSANAQRAEINIDLVSLSAEQMQRIDKISQDPERHRRLNIVAFEPKTETVFGWHISKLGWATEKFYGQD
ncbi:hypothetical protein MVES1_000925 [Malassezia vespertilionis]|uniref:NADP-dependent oxidoreductase domain-containing protein n=1 Tax=Malassezia vespertilionis TaxID=2020962 RepID=A0A2N1JE55_9BASI|nr:uncharacterized protein MVES1_000925 [Malassezia vespertilionis]PKI84824.1 hypothetical protein MVES_000871 [Malassezia vespertilionis]WFD05595.1 hypothetical protein MVES1_000925 [Malassezia vespertilionis]